MDMPSVPHKAQEGQFMTVKEAWTSWSILPFYLLETQYGVQNFSFS